MNDRDAKAPVGLRRRETRQLLEKIRSGTSDKPSYALVIQAVELWRGDLRGEIDAQRLAILCHRYLLAEKMTVKDIALAFTMDKRTVYREIARAVDTLSTYIYCLRAGLRSAQADGNRPHA